ncbi:Ribosomal-protein-alanine acetyltransferase [Hyella patelloides LEGE 07179]|uniref:Ribosomal-protein-alanine acetyltransferase n=1 Tax=Hyella patelloides LEGE 07179 TaxID=945734 RepID=A0A563VZZ5_9CYAN|nr:ribosomal protein S18-alanine N-acetyltransferase [Hyella patelloides]VEP17011.1 Ribosomal-protein-alanine acetyltransferase [Hyella patelloides LEGE 07179]
MIKRLEIKPAIANQVKDIIVLDQLCFDGIWSKHGYLREINSPNSSLLLLWVTETDLSPKMLGIGCLWSILEEAHITLLGIHPEYHRQGLGMLLLHSLLQEGVTRGLKRATLEVRPTNQPAINLYEKFGFKVAGRRRNYYPKTGEDALILWLNGLNKGDFQQQLDSWRLQIKKRLLRHYTIA